MVGVCGFWGYVEVVLFVGGGVVEVVVGGGWVGDCGFVGGS